MNAPLSIMHCRLCNKYIGGKTDLTQYFFWCDKECFEKESEVIRLRNVASMERHEDAYKGKPKFGMTGSIDSIADDGEESSEKKEKSKKSSSSSKSIIDKVIDESEEEKESDSDETTPVTETIKKKKRTVKRKT